MDWIFYFGVDGSSFVDWVTDDIHNSAEGFGADWNTDWCAGIDDFLASDETFSRVHSNSSDSGVSQMLGNFEDQSVLNAFDL